MQKSIEIANSSDCPGYLDRLQEVYPFTLEAERDLTPETEQDLQKIFESGDDVALIK